MIHLKNNLGRKAEEPQSPPMLAYYGVSLPPTGSIPRNGLSHWVPQSHSHSHCCSWERTSAGRAGTTDTVTQYSRLVL